MLGHVLRMDDDRFPTDLLYVDIDKGGRGRGGPLLRYSDVCKRDLKALTFSVPFLGFLYCYCYGPIHNCQIM